MVRLLKHPQTLPSMYYRRIGEIAYRWNMIELYLQNLTWHFLGLDVKQGRLLTYWPGPGEKISVFEALPQRWVDDQDVADEILSIAKEAEKLRFKRNNIVHGIWGHERGNNDRLELFELTSTEHKILPVANKMDKSELKKQAERFAVLQGRLVHLHAQVGAPLP